MLPKVVIEYLQSHRDEHLAKLFEFLRFASIANLQDEPDPCQACAEWLTRHLKSLGLQAEIAGTSGKPNVLATAQVGEDLPTLLIYGHYDVQPPEPLDLWKTDPFEPVVKDGYIYARGASDDKGQLFTHLMAIEAWLRAGSKLPVNLKLLIEGEEEIGSPNLEPFVTAHHQQLTADAAVISDSEFFAPDLPSITYALRGLSYVEVTFSGPRSDVHSGLHGGALVNPINALTRMISQLHDADGRVTIPGFYDDVLELSQDERRAWEELPFDEAAYAASLGVDILAGGERVRSVLERRWARPTLDCNGIFGGHTATGAKTIIPSSATAKISMRLVPNQEPEKIAAGFERFVGEHTPAGVVASVSISAKARAVLLGLDCPAIRAARAALLEAFGREAAMIRCGASVPATELIQRLLGLDTAMMGFALPDDNLHAPNERFRLDHLWRGSHAAAAFMQILCLPRKNKGRHSARG